MNDKITVVTNEQTNMPYVFSEKTFEVKGWLTKREYFAGMAMQAIVGSSDFKGSWQTLAEMSVIQADALISALNGGSDEQLTPADKRYAIPTPPSPSEIRPPTSGSN